MLINITIDDTLPSPKHETVTYDPPSAWNAQGLCSTGPCSVSPDTSKIHSGTWHESTFHAKPSHVNVFPNQPLSATVRFRGSAVYVYAVLPPATGDKVQTAAITFYIDGMLVSGFSHASFHDYVYDFLVYANSSLSLDSHEVKIVNGKPGGARSLFILDRIVYSTSIAVDSPPSTPTMSIEPVSTAPHHNPSPSSSPASDHSLPPGTIAGIVLGSLAGIIVIITMILYFCRRRRRQKKDNPSENRITNINIHGGGIGAHPNFGPQAGRAAAGGYK